ncbi:hypothetical protein [Streptomyces sp. NPDC015345]|uniref:hypothetical protein n=1 Tax=Streptomyces sp. NPDC015345 TaxID=3364953 RepID=UPI0036F841F4
MCPTSAQRQLIQAGSAACWITKDTVLIPYGGHPGTYPALEGEDWSGEMASWAKDWKISHPYPADDAAWWGLIPLPLIALGQHTGFRPAPAFALMTALEKAQHGREAHRRRLAREHAHSQAAPPAPAVADPLPCEEPAPAAPATPPPTPAAPPPVLPPPPAQAPLPRVPAPRRRLLWRRLLSRRWRR